MFPRRVAILSDIHAHYDALRAVLDACARAGVEAYWCLGDLVGRGDRPLRVTEALYALAQDPANVFLAGNHDWLATGRIAPGAFIEAHEASDDPAISTTGMQPGVVSTALAHGALLRDARQAHLLAWLDRLPASQALAQHPGYAPLAGWYLAHGYYDPDDPYHAVMSYTKVPLTAQRQLNALNRYNTERARLVAVGHWHRAVMWRAAPGARLPHPVDPWAGPHTIDLEAGAVFIVAGSVGVINAFNPRPSFVILDIASPTEVSMTFRRLEAY